MDEHLKIYQLALNINMMIDNLEKDGHSLNMPFNMSLGDLQGLTKRIQTLEEENLDLKLKLVTAGVSL